MKYLLLVLLGLVSFVGALLGAMALSGNLNAEALQRLTGAAPPEQAQTTKNPEMDMDSLVRQLREKEKALADKELELKEREAQLKLREDSLQTLRAEVEQMQQSIQGSLGEADAERKSRIETVALTLAEMRPAKAAERLDGMAPEDAADILNLIEVKARGKIVEAMDPQSATRVLRQLQEKNQ